MAVLGVQQGDSDMYTCIPLGSYCRILNIIPCAVWWVPVVNLFVTVYLIILSSSFISVLSFHVSNLKFVFYAYEPISVL